MYQSTSHNICVNVTPQFLEDASSPELGRYIWSYTILIQNKGCEAVQLCSRYWQITDAQGRVQEVRGPGVVGEQPTIEPGGSYSYTSNCPLNAPSGIMIGAYQMRSESGATFEISVPAFSLDSPDAYSTIN